MAFTCHLLLLLLLLPPLLLLSLWLPS